MFFVELCQSTASSMPTTLSCSTTQADIRKTETGPAVTFNWRHRASRGPGSWPLYNARLMTSADRIAACALPSLSC